MTDISAPEEFSKLILTENSLNSTQGKRAKIPWHWQYCDTHKCYYDPNGTHVTWCMREMEDHIRRMEQVLADRRANAQRQVKSRYPLGPREFTITYSSNWMTDEEARPKMERALKRLCGYYADDIVKLRAVGEVGRNGLSHIHCFYKLKGGLKITDKNFKRAWEHWNPKKKLGWGFEGGHHAEVKNEADFLGYIDKDISNAWFEHFVANDI